VRVEPDLHLARRDPTRERHQRVRVEFEARLLLCLAHRRLGLGLASVHGAAREDPRAAHEARGGIALHQQQLEAGFAVADGDDGGGGARLGDLAGVELLAWRRPVDPHAATLLTFAAA
jgi:hypothetical protein